jgi:hypothetical protein
MEDNKVKLPLTAFWRNAPFLIYLPLAPLLHFCSRGFKKTMKNFITSILIVFA